MAVIFGIVKAMELYVNYYDKHHTKERRDTAHPA
jgi:hypothetical protein